MGLIGIYENVLMLSDIDAFVWIFIIRFLFICIELLSKMLNIIFPIVSYYIKPFNLDARDYF